MVVAKNPILSGFYPDPSICRVGKDFYIVNSSFVYAKGVQIFHSRDLAKWKKNGNDIEKGEQQIHLSMDGFIAIQLLFIKAQNQSLIMCAYKYLRGMKKRNLLF